MGYSPTAVVACISRSAISTGSWLLKWLTKFLPIVNGSNLPGGKILLLILGKMFCFCKKLSEACGMDCSQKSMAGKAGRTSLVCSTSIASVLNSKWYWLLAQIPHWSFYLVQRQWEILTQLRGWVRTRHVLVPNKFLPLLGKDCDSILWANWCNIVVEEFAKEVLSETTFPVESFTKN